LTIYLFGLAETEPLMRRALAIGEQAYSPRHCKDAQGRP
jgi:hypothetical protein